MQVYIYKANIYCEDCAFDHDSCLYIKWFGETQATIEKDVSQRLIADTGDSDNFPQGPYANGGGESDTPQHCATCGLFLENPLTSDGYDYVKQAIQDYLADMGGDGPVVEQWSHFYNLPLEE